MKRSFALTALLAVGATTVAQADTPPPPPQKLAENFGFTCLMLSEREPATNLSVGIRFEPMTEQNSFYRKAYWWTLSDGDERFPSNETFKNMRTLETETPQSVLFFDTADGWRYTYTLHYAVEERYPEFVYVPDHMVVRRRPAGESTSAWELVGIGECRLSKTEAVQ